MRDVPMRDGLINSLNVVTVEVATQTGLARTANVANQFGLPRPEPFPALALGTTEATPLQMAAASALAGKTGTSRDGWFVGYTPNLVCAVWVGFDDNGQLGMTGGEAALPIWMDFMKAALDLRPDVGAKTS